LVRLYGYCGNNPVATIDPSGNYDLPAQPGGGKCCVFIWNGNGGWGHASLSCGGQYFSFWPVDPGQAIKNAQPCISHTYLEDTSPETGEGRPPDSTACLF
jgi:hypothetical protein